MSDSYNSIQLINAGCQSWHSFWAGNLANQCSFRVAKSPPTCTPTDFWWLGRVRMFGALWWDPRRCESRVEPETVEFYVGGSLVGRLLTGGFCGSGLDSCFWNKRSKVETQKW